MNISDEFAAKIEAASTRLLKMDVEEMRKSDVELNAPVPIEYFFWVLANSRSVKVV